MKLEGERERKGGREGMIAVQLAHEFPKESYDWQSHAAGLCVHTSHCTAADTTHTHPCTHSNTSRISVASLACISVCVLEK